MQLHQFLRALAVIGFCALGTPRLCVGDEKAPVRRVIHPNLPSKKLIEYGWDQFNHQDPAFIRDHIGEMEKRPFDGIAFRLADSGGEIFNLAAWDEKKLEPQLNVLRDIKWDKFTDNFVMMYAGSTMDWFSDDDWKKVLAHAKFCARAAKAARCKGIMFDPEPYVGDRNVWYNDEKKEKSGHSFDEYIAQARKRGAQFMNVMQAEMPDIKILSLYGYQRFYHQSQSVDATKRDATLNGDGFALLAAFFDGALEAAGNRTQLIDGNEHSYYYQTPDEFYRSYLGMRQGAKVYAAPDVREKYDRIVRASQSVYVDYVFSMRPEIFKDIPSVNLSPTERARWFEHNLYYALQTSDEYVWMWCETMDWWRNQNIPAGLEESIISAKGKIAHGEELGFKLSGDAMKLEVPAITKE